MQRFFSLAAATVLSAAAIAQSPLTTTFANNNGGASGGGVYFDLTVNVPIQITGLDLNFSSAASTAGNVEVWTLNPGTRLGNQTNQGLWTMVATGTTVAAGPGLPSPVTLSNNIPLGVGTLGVTIVAVAGGVSHAYTNGNGTNQNYSVAELSLAAGEASNTAFVAPLFTPRVVNCNIHFVPGGSGTVATKARYGQGNGEFASTYQDFPAASFDLNGANFQYDELAGGGWRISAGAGPVTLVNPAVLPLTDDSEVTQALGSPFAATVNVCSNGFISIGGSNGTAFTPSVTTMLNNAFEGFYVWHDFNPAAAGSGQVKYEFINGEDVFMWDGVFSFGGATGNTFQIILSGAPGARRVRCCFVSMSGDGTNYLVAYSPAGASADPGNTDISAAPLPVTLAATDVPRLTFDASARPVIGTTISLDTTNARASVNAGVVFLSGVQDLAGLNLAPFAPNNRLHLGLPILLLGSYGVTAGSGSLSLPIPNNNSLINGHVYLQSVTVVPGLNPWQIATSNGLDLKFGNL